MSEKFVNGWNFEYCGSMAKDWHTAAQVICDNLPVGIEQPSDEVLYKLIAKICKDKGYDINYMPEHITFVPVF
jgi:hypothetical protein